MEKYQHSINLWLATKVIVKKTIFWFIDFENNNYVKTDFSTPGVCVCDLI